jgi:hypothetical protein
MDQKDGRRARHADKGKDADGTAARSSDVTAVDAEVRTESGIGEPRLEIAPKNPVEGEIVHLRGSGWPDCPIRIAVDDERVAVARTSVGTGEGEIIRPAPDGSFEISLLTHGWSRGRHGVTARSEHRDGAFGRVPVTVRERPLSEMGGEGERPRARAVEFYRRRFSSLGAVPPGLRQFQMSQVRGLRARVAPTHRVPASHLDTAEATPARETGIPVPGACNWTPVGPAGIVVGAGSVWSGRTLSIAFGNPPSTIFVGTAGGGVWKSSDSGQSWSPKSDYQVSLAIGAIAVDPNQALHVLAGTGEYDNWYIGTYFGNGILRSDDGGDTWTEVGGPTFARAEISRIAFDPTDATGQRVVLASSIGVFDSSDGGSTWTLARSGSASDLVLFHPSGPPNRVTVVAAFESSGLWTATRTGGGWGPWTQLTGPAFPTTFDRITMAQQRADPKVIYALFGSGWNVAGMARTLDGSTWTQVEIRLHADCWSRSDSAPGHFHDATVAGADLAASPALAHTYPTTSGGAIPHTHSVALTAAQMAAIARGASAGLSTTADASGHQHSFGFSLTAQLGYDMCAAVHPTDSDTAFLGERSLWKTTTGGGVFDPLPILHTDEHALAFEPGSASILWMTSDGGVFRSPNGGANWEDRNRDLATLEYIGLAQHPTWETVLLGGTQDNGTHRYSGSLAWRLVDGGDGGFAAIDPSVPTRMYHEYIGSSFYSSDDAGSNWADANQGVTGGAPFYSPFAIDPADHNVCYFGGFELWRRDFSVAGSTWTAITAGMGGGATAVAVDPADASRIYVAADNGKVWRVQRTGATWALADVTRTDYSNGLPAQSLSDLAIDAAGTVWASVSAVYSSEAPGEFSSDHVFRRALADAAFASRSTGLAQGNPVNSIVIDPASSTRLFVGCDVGIFRTDNGGLNWTPWDEGVPNVPVFDLVLHNGRRLLRAATHGRSIWERPIDALSCPMVDLYVRDDLVDSGRVQPTPSGVPDPLSPAGVLTHWWQSPDVKVDAPEPTFQTPTAISDYVSFEASIVHRTARRNRTNRFYVQVHNRGINPAPNVQVRAFFANASAGLPNLPADFWSSGKPFIGTPSGTDWTAIGPTQSIASVAAGRPAIVEWDWAIPAGAAEHSCLFVVTTCADDPVNGSGLFDVGQAVTTRKQITLKNLHVLDPVPGGEQSHPITVRLNNPSSEAMVADLLVHFGNFPGGTRLWAAIDRGERRGTRDPGETERARRLFRETKLRLPKEADDDCGARREIDVDDIYMAQAGKKGEQVLLPEVIIPAGSWRTVVMYLEQPSRIPANGLQFDVLQRVGDRIVGGSTYRIEPRAKPVRRSRRTSPINA